MRAITVFPLFCLVWLCIASMPATADDVAKPDAGPENGGLCLRLIMRNHLEKKNDSRTIRLELLNPSDEPKTLVGQWEYEESSGDYATWLRHVAEFTTFPEVMTDDAGTEGNKRTSPQPTHEIKPGGMLAVEWEENGRILKEPDDSGSDHFNKAPTLPSEGTYLVRASVLVVTPKGQRILLPSNEQPVIIGGRRTLPKYAVGRLLSSNEDTKTAELRLGSDQRIEAGDLFTLHSPDVKGVAWRLRITKVKTWRCEGALERIDRDSLAAERFPQRDWLVTLESPF